MLDRGLLLSITAVLVVLIAFGRTRRTHEPALSDVAFWPAIVGLVAGRLVALALDDPTSLRTARNLFLLRGGVELWPGVAAGTLTALALLRRHRQPLHATIGLLVPSAVAAWATYDLACLVRDGCPGPATSIGLRPPGLTTTQLPVGVLVGLVGLAAAAWLRKISADHATTAIILSGLLTVSALRSIESIWLPSLTEGLTRQTAQSLGVLAGTGVAAAVVVARRHMTRGASFGTPVQPPAPHADLGPRPPTPIRSDNDPSSQPTKP